MYNISIVQHLHYLKNESSGSQDHTKNLLSNTVESSGSQDHTKNLLSNTVQKARGKRHVHETKKLRN